MSLASAPHVATGTWRDYATPEHIKDAQGGKQAYMIAVQIVFDNPFSTEAKHSFPQIRVDWSMLSLVSWATRLQSWFSEHLTPDEQKLFLNTEFILP